MSDALATRLSLLVRLRDARDDGAWSQFVDLYAPLVFGFARKHGLQDADAADLTGLREVGGDAGRLGVGDAVDFGAGITRLVGHRRAAYEAAPRGDG